MSDIWQLHIHSLWRWLPRRLTYSLFIAGPSIATLLFHMTLADHALQCCSVKWEFVPVQICLYPRYQWILHEMLWWTTTQMWIWRCFVDPQTWTPALAILSCYAASLERPTSVLSFLSTASDDKIYLKIVIFHVILSCSITISSSSTRTWLIYKFIVQWCDVQYDLPITSNRRAKWWVLLSLSPDSVFKFWSKRHEQPYSEENSPFTTTCLTCFKPPIQIAMQVCISCAPGSYL